MRRICVVVVDHELDFADKVAEIGTVEGDGEGFFGFGIGGGGGDDVGVGVVGGEEGLSEWYR